MGGWRMLCAVVLPMALLSVGCMEPSDEAKARLAETKASGDALIKQFGGLEDRFLVNQQNVKLYDELRRRHGQVQEVACANQGSHYAQMVQHMEKTTEKARKIRRRNVASANVTLSRVSGTGGSGKNKRAHD